MDWNLLRSGSAFSLTGFPAYVLDAVFTKYESRMRLCCNEPVKSQCCKRVGALMEHELQEAFFVMLMYIFIYPKWDQIKTVLRFPKERFRTICIPLMLALSRCINEVHWDDRLRPFNHVSHFPTHVTWYGIIYIRIFT